MLIGVHSGTEGDFGEGCAAVGRLVNAEPPEVDGVGVGGIDIDVHVVPTLAVAVRVGGCNRVPGSAAVRALEDAEQSEGCGALYAGVERSWEGRRNRDVNASDVGSREPSCKLGPTSATVGGLVNAIARVTKDIAERCVKSRGVRRVADGVGCCSSQKRSPGIAAVERTVYSRAGRDEHVRIARRARRARIDQYPRDGLARIASALESGGTELSPC